VRVELGSETVMQPGRDTWHEVSFEREIENAVVVMGPLEHLGSHDAVVRVRDVTSTGFEFQIEEWDYLDGWHTTETVGWMAVEAGTHALASGQVISAGSVTSNTDYDAPVQVALDGFDAAPSVFAQVASHAGGQTVTTRLRDIEADGFEVLLQEQEASDDWHRPERVDWIALDEGVDGLIDLSDVPGGLSGRYETVGFDPVDDVPVALAAMQTMRGGDTASLRFRDLDADSIGLRVAEEQSRDAERGHVTEDVALLVSTEGSHDLLLA
jgi:hypothetical protein